MSNVYDVLCPFCRHVNRSTAKFCQACGQDIILNNDNPGGDDRRYHIIRVIKAGGQGSVYAGVDQDGKVYAIKEMLDDYATSAERDDSLRRFNAEAELLQGLHHPRIPRIYSHFTDEGRHYLTMDLVQGEDLEEIIDREGSLPEHVVLHWADQVCDVLAYLHNQGLIYRDMKPSNIMIEQDGNIKLIDFGIAKVFVPHKQGTLIGTPGYSPPEQYQGLATTLSDIYALGATLHHLLTGRDPTQHQPFSFEPPQRINPAISSRTNAAIVQALSFKPEDRFETVVEFRSMLRPLPGTSGLLSPMGQSTVVLPRGGGQQPTAQPHAQAPLPAPTGATQQPATGSVKTQLATQATPQGKPKRKKKRSSCVVWVIAMLLILGGVGYFGITLFYEQIQEYIPVPAATSSVPPTPASTPLPLPTGFIVLDIEAQVAVAADEQTIQEAFLASCEQKIQQQYGQDVRIQRPYTTFVAGDAPGSGQWTQVATQGDVVVYRATMQTMLYRP